MLCILLCLCGCTGRSANELRHTDEDIRPYTGTTETVQEDSLKIPVENEAIEWPTAEEIRTTIAAEQTEVYWLANAIQIPEQMNCYTVDALDMEMFWDTLKEKLQNGKGAIESGTLSIFNGAEQIQPVLEELSRVTGTAFVEVSVAEEDTTIQCSYAQAVDGIVLDTEGYTPGGGSEVIPGTRVDVYQDGRVSIQNPLRVGQKTRTLSKADLMDIEEVQDLCRIYYENCGLPCVTVVTGGGLVYYSSDGELRPAWSLEETWYPSENGHITSQMLDGQTGEFFDIWNNNRNTQDTKKYMTEEQAKELANKYYKLFGYKEGEYEITDVQSVNNEGNDKGPGFRMTVTYNKKYGDVYNPYEYISITLESKNMEMDMFRVDNIPFDNNEVVITENEAVNIALKEDEKIETNKVESTKAKLMVVKMNADAYNRINDKDKYYEAMQTPNYPIEERNYYNVDDRVRKAWVVVINYEDNYNGDIVKRYTEGKYSYFVDATTGEIIGGHTLDYIYSASQR
mgnify:CR=1 FL=1